MGYDPCKHCEGQDCEDCAYTKNVDRLRTKLEAATSLFSLNDCDGERAKTISAPEDEAVLQLCIQHGFGAVMDSAARQWFLRDPIGSFVVGTCAATVRKIKRVLSGKPRDEATEKAYAAQRAKAWGLESDGQGKGKA
jgi:hypothetical protein